MKAANNGTQFERIGFEFDPVSYAIGKAKGGGGGGGVTVEELSVTQNGEYSEEGVAYSPVTVEVPNSYAAGDEGKVVSNGALVAQTAHATVTTNGTVDTTLNDSVVINVANSYGPYDNGKVVQNGALVSQTAHTKVTQNGTVDTTYNNSVVVDVPSVTPTLVTKNITENGTYAASSDNADGYSSVTVDVSGGGGSPEAEPKDVNFIDYDGTILYSYTAAEFAQLSALPANPSHDGLTAQGWNWGLSDAKTYVASYGMLWIGQQYTTTDGKTRIYIHLEHGRISPWLLLSVGQNSQATIAWGDGATDTVSGVWAATIVSRNHTYAQPGDYVITITVSQGTITIVGNGSGSSLLQASNNTSEAEAGHVYRSAIRRVEIGSGIAIGDGAFRFCLNLESVVIPTSVTVLGQHAFYNCLSLVGVVLPSSCTEIKGYSFAYCYGMRRISIPKTMTKYAVECLQNCRTLTSLSLTAAVSGSEGWNDFANDYGLTRVTIPEGWIYTNSFFTKCYSLANVTIPASIGELAGDFFKDCYGLAEIHFKASSPPTISSSSAFSNVPTSCKIYVPSGKKSAYQSATNYPGSSYTYVEE